MQSRTETHWNDNQDRQAIETLFTKLEEVELRSPPRDEEAESFVRSQIARQPAAPYYMAQTIVVQDQALTAAQGQIEELQRQLSQRPAQGGLLSGFFGGANSQPQGSSDYGRQQRLAASQPIGTQASGRGGGGFLAGAAQTAMGVAGGVLLGNMIAGAFGGDEANAGELDSADQQAEEADIGEDIGLDTDF